MARLIRTEKEVEGRYEEVWLVVDEDALEQWPPGAASAGARFRRLARACAYGERSTAAWSMPGKWTSAV